MWDYQPKHPQLLEVVPNPPLNSPANMTKRNDGWRSPLTQKYSMAAPSRHIRSLSPLRKSRFRASNSTVPSPHIDTRDARRHSNVSSATDNRFSTRMESILYELRQDQQNITNKEVQRKKKQLKKLFSPRSPNHRNSRSLSPRANINVDGPISPRGARIKLSHSHNHTVSPVKKPTIRRSPLATSLLRRSRSLSTTSHHSRVPEELFPSPLSESPQKMIIQQSTSTSTKNHNRSSQHSPSISKNVKKNNTHRSMSPHRNYDKRQWSPIFYSDRVGGSGHCQRSPKSLRSASWNPTENIRRNEALKEDSPKRLRRKECYHPDRSPYKPKNRRSRSADFASHYTSPRRTIGTGRSHHQRHYHASSSPSKRSTSRSRSSSRQKSLSKSLTTSPSKSPRRIRYHNSYSPSSSRPHRSKSPFSSLKRHSRSVERERVVVLDRPKQDFVDCLDWRLVSPRIHEGRRRKHHQENKHYLAQGRTDRLCNYFVPFSDPEDTLLRMVLQRRRLQRQNDYDPPFHNNLKFYHGSLSSIGRQSFHECNPLHHGNHSSLRSYYSHESSLDKLALNRRSQQSVPVKTRHQLCGLSREDFHC